MRRFLVIGAGAAAFLTTAFAPGAVQAQGKAKSCSDAYAECTSRTQMSKECEAERAWCVKTGTFADPKTKAVLSGLRKK
jgi:hypothetical protein